MYDAVLFDLLTGLVDSWSLWDRVAGDSETGRRWRLRYLEVGYATGAYRPYEELVAEAAEAEGLPVRLADELVDHWDELSPWPETANVLRQLSGRVRVGIVTNCSVDLGHRAVANLGAPVDVVLTAEEISFYKPRPEAYRAGIAALGSSVERTLFVAGSPYDLSGATGVGLDVWWHNRAGLDRGDRPAPVAEHDSLQPLPAFLLGPDNQRP